MATEDKPLVIGLYGCYCHPFESWDDHDKYKNQKIEIGEKYRIRHTGEECIATGFDKATPHFINVFVEPYDCERCKQFEHKMNLIKI